MTHAPSIEGISAITLRITDMAESVRFYEVLGFTRRYGGEGRPFTSYSAGAHYLNLIAGEANERASGEVRWWGRAIFYVSDVDAMYRVALEAGFAPQSPPRDAEWGERYFHLLDPDGHELSFARRLPESR